MQSEKIFRVGDKLISFEKITRLAARALELREQGHSQQAAAARLGLERTFVSRLEKIGAVRRGKRVAVIGFPLANGEELGEVCRRAGLDFFLLLNNEQRWALVREQQALTFLDKLMELVARLRQYDALIMITSTKWLHLAEALLHKEVLFIELGDSPISRDRCLEPARLERVLADILDGQPGKESKE